MPGRPVQPGNANQLGHPFPQSAELVKEDQLRENDAAASATKTSKQPAEITVSVSDNSEQKSSPVLNASSVDNSDNSLSTLAAAAPETDVIMQPSSFTHLRRLSLTG